MDKVTAGHSSCDRQFLGPHNQTSSDLFQHWVARELPICPLNPLCQTHPAQAWSRYDLKTSRSFEFFQQGPFHENYHHVFLGSCTFHHYFLHPAFTRLLVLLMGPSYYTYVKHLQNRSVHLSVLKKADSF